MNCCDCKKEIISTKRCAYEIRGFETDRKQGGTNHIWRRKRTGRLLCPDCTLNMTAGVPLVHPDQLAIP